ncbi:unnamed protein product, partial [Aureobasidium uvarum]
LLRQWESLRCIICFGDKKVFAHKVILAGVSELFHTAFNSNFSVANQADYQIKDYTHEVVYAMIKHIYCNQYDSASKIINPTLDQRLDFWINILLVANEYQLLRPSPYPFSDSPRRNAVQK